MMRPAAKASNAAGALLMRRAPCWAGQCRANAYTMCALLTARNALVGMRVRLENEIRSLLKTFGIMFGKRVGGFLRRAEEVIAEDLKVAPELRPIFETLVSARHAILDRIRRLDAQISATARRDRTVKLFMAAPGVGPITALAVAAAFDDPARFRRSSSAGAYLGLTPRRYESGEISYNGRSSKRGDTRAFQRCVPPGRVARMRSRPGLWLTRTAHTTSIHPPPPTPTSGDRGENHGARRASRTQRSRLTSAIREPGTQSSPLTEYVTRSRPNSQTTDCKILRSEPQPTAKPLLTTLGNE